MTRNELLGALCFPEYNFLRENEHLGKHRSGCAEKAYEMIFDNTSVFVSENPELYGH